MVAGMVAAALVLTCTVIATEIGIASSLLTSGPPSDCPIVMNATECESYANDQSDQGIGAFYSSVAPVSQVTYPTGCLEYDASGGFYAPDVLRRVIYNTANSTVPCNSFFGCICGSNLTTTYSTVTRLGIPFYVWLANVWVPSPPPPSPPPPTSPLPSPVAPSTTLCFDDCVVYGLSGPVDKTSDGQCDDGGAGSETGQCWLGYDCTDCGVRHVAFPPAVPPTSPPPSTSPYPPLSPPPPSTQVAPPPPSPLG